jgi:hypothetical protein
MSAETIADVSMMQCSLSTISFTSWISDATSAGAAVYMCSHVS